MSDSSVPSDDEIAALLGDYVLGDVETPGTDPDVNYITPEEQVVDNGSDPIADDNIESGFEESTVQVGDGTCRVCGAPTFRPAGLTASGRKKRAPLYCDMHSPKRRVQTERSFAGGVEDSSQLQRIKEELADDLRLLGMLAGPLLPVTGYYVIDHADAFTIAVLKLAKNNQSVLRVLHRVAQVAPIYTVAETVAGTAYSIQVDTKKADPHNTIAQRLGVERAYNQVYPDSTETLSSNGFQPAPTYAATK